MRDACSQMDAQQMTEPVNCSRSELSTYLQELAAGFLPTYCLDTGPSAPSRSMSIASKSYQRGKRTVVFHGFPSLRMSRPSTGDLGADLSMSSPVDFHAKTSARPGRGPESTASDQDSGAKWRGSLARYDRDSRSWKTHQFSLLGGLTEFSETWPRWGSMRDGELYPLQTSALRTKGKGFGSWPTPVAQEDNGSPDAYRKRHDRRLRPNKKITSLQVAAKSWSTPHKDTGNCENVPENGLLGRMVKSWSEKTEPRASLNPEFHLWLQGWPEGWNDLSPQGTDRFRLWLQRHGRF